MRYYIDYGTGAGNEWVDGSLKEAKRIADEGICYTQKSIHIYDEDRELISTRRWVGSSFCPEEYDDKPDVVIIGQYGYYGEWFDEKDLFKIDWHLF